MLLNHLDHIAFRVADFKPVVNFYTQQLGFDVVQEMEMNLGNSRATSRVLNLPGQPFYIFVDQGLDEQNIISRWVKKHGSGLHHSAYLVDDIYAASAQLRRQGMRFTTEEVIDTGGGLKQLFSLPNPVTNILTEIIQRDRSDVFFVQGNVIQLIQSTEKL
jgi:4-hydroxyphenylpyruvate dioxygenase-like putative hemolysin